MRLLLTIALATTVAFGQESAAIPFNAPPPPMIPSASAVVIGQPGGGTHYYWIVAKYVGGNSAPAGPITVTSAPLLGQLSTLRFVKINWQAAVNATGYDVLRTAVNSRPSGACDCALVTGTTDLEVLDTGSALSAYTVTTGAKSYARILLDNVNVATPKLRQDIDGVISDIGSGSGSSTLPDFATVRTSSTVLTIAAGTGRSGATVYPIAEATATWSSGSASGVAYVYMDSSGVLTVGHNTANTLSCSVCVVATGVTDFPADSIPIWTWPFTSGAWDATGGVDKRSYLSTKVIRAGTNVTVVNNADGSDTVSATGGSTVAANPPYLQIGSTNYVGFSMLEATVPVIGDFTKIGAGTLAAAGAAMVATLDTAGTIWTKALPGGAKQVTWAYHPELAAQGGNGNMAGVGVRNSGTGKFIICANVTPSGISYTPGYFRCTRWGTGYAYEDIYGIDYPNGQTPMFVRSSISGGTITIASSATGAASTFQTVITIPEADLGGSADQYLFGGMTNAGAQSNVRMTVLSVKEN